MSAPVPSTVARRRTRSTKKIGEYLGPSPFLRATRTEILCAAVGARLFPRAAKCYEPHLSAQDVGELRRRGGALTKVADYMRAEPSVAQELAAYVQGMADAISPNGEKCVLDVSVRARRDDSAQDVALNDLLVALAQKSLTADDLVELIEACDAQQASTRVLRAAAAAQLEEMCS